MLVSDLLNSCAHEGVAEAAVASIGGSFAARLQAEAEERGVSVGVLASGLVREFARDAGERDWRDLVGSIRGQDFPVLTGLELIVGRRRRDERRPSSAATALPFATRPDRPSGFGPQLRTR